jgi:hypothetical protein
LGTGISRQGTRSPAASAAVSLKPSARLIAVADLPRARMAATRASRELDL